MRRRVGVGAIQKQKLEEEKYKDKGTELQKKSNGTNFQTIRSV